MLPSRPVTMEFHISRLARDLYQFDQSIFSISGNVILVNFHAARIFAARMNQKRDLIRFPEQSVKAGQINAMGLIDEILHYIMDQYRTQRNPAVMAQALEYLNKSQGGEAVDQALGRFVDQFPALAVYRREIGVHDYLQGETQGVPNRQIILEEMILLWLANLNPAFSPFFELFDDADLRKTTAYSQMMSGLHQFFETQPRFGPDNQNLIDMLRSPAIHSPYSLSGQLEFIRQRWSGLVGGILFRLLSSLDLIQEEEKAVFWGPGPARVYEFVGLDREIERFSPDRDWMPALVLLAKNAYVWLDQLSRQYQRPIRRLDEVPDSELEKIGRWGFTGLWLIGLWERSPASQRVKKLRGNPDAVASAYSLFEYQIAAGLGGEEGYQAFRDRARKYGIRLASDMVPNHMGIDSRWVVEHPDWFISLEYSPFPGYSYNGPNLSWDDRVGIYLEDHYYDSSDAAVVFMRRDQWTGQARFIYHGNDGTSMPWNDTAQLNYLLPEVREAVIQTILHVARKFPIIRFDAAMTLAKKHYQRLWFPEPGTGGAIPTRAEHGLTREQFDAAFPEEFWREVVDRVAREVPDTLLLAEAFWLMEGYFVRTLGMHRVYNSAFMNMLRDEKNQEYRQVIKNTVEFDPEILKRYVNFMNNPDERTAVDQFGKGDKYFGVSVLLATLPGLPMVGHGQVEGFSEKYGMEFQRAYWDEVVDGYLVERHEREIFPLFRKRYLFAEARDFLLYDFYVADGSVTEDVFAYSNRAGDERALVLYHNRFAEARGWIRDSAAFTVKRDGGGERALIRKSLGEGLGLHSEANYFVIFRDQISGLEYIRNSREIHHEGLYIELDAYQYHVFLEFREVEDNQWRQYGQLASYLNGRGVPNIAEALKELFLQPIHEPFRQLANAELLRRLFESRNLPPGAAERADLLDEVGQKAASLLGELNRFIGSGRNEAEIAGLAEEVQGTLAAVLELANLAELTSLGKSKKLFRVARTVAQGTGLEADEARFAFGVLYGWAVIHLLGRLQAEGDGALISRSWMDEYLLGRILASALNEFGLGQHNAEEALQIIALLTLQQGWCDLAKGAKGQAYRVLSAWLQDNDIQRFLGLNRYQGILWFNQEAFSSLLNWMMALPVVEALKDLEIAAKGERLKISACDGVIRAIAAAEKRSEYQVEKLLEALEQEA